MDALAFLRNSSVNNSKKDVFQSRMSSRDDIIIGILLCCAWPLALFFNVIVIMVGLHSWKKFKPIDLLILHLAILDLGTYY